MRKYIQLTALPDDSSGITLPVLMSQIVEKLHLLFVLQKKGNNSIPVGLSFPGYDSDSPTLGNMIRIHGQEDELDRLDVQNSLRTLRDYIHITQSRPIPVRKLKGYVSYSRVRLDHSKDKLIRRYMKRHSKTFEEAEKHYSDYQSNNPPDYPFVWIVSQSTGQKYPIHLKQQYLDKPGQSFNTFGINPSSGVDFF